MIKGTQCIIYHLSACLSVCLSLKHVAACMYVCTYKYYPSRKIIQFFSLVYFFILLLLVGDISQSHQSKKTDLKMGVEYFCDFHIFDLHTKSDHSIIVSPSWAIRCTIPSAVVTSDFKSANITALQHHLCPSAPVDTGQGWLGSMDSQRLGSRHLVSAQLGLLTPSVRTLMCTLW